jgi:hypothetical protein
MRCATALSTLPTMLRWTMTGRCLAPVCADVVQVELLGWWKWIWTGGQGGLAAGAVGNLDVDLGTVERRLSLDGLVHQAGAVQDVGLNRAAARCHISGAATYFPPAPRRESR